MPLLLPLIRNSPTSNYPKQNLAMMSSHVVNDTFIKDVSGLLINVITITSYLYFHDPTKNKVKHIEFDYEYSDKTKKVCFVLV